MKFKNLIITSVVLSTLVLSSCVSLVEDYMGNWERKSYFKGRARAEGVSFEIDNFGYFGMGKNDDIYFSDFFKYDPSTDSWTQVADFPGTPRAYSVSISNDQFGYAGLGYDGDDDLEDFWKYDPAKNEWTQVDNFPGKTRRYATAFAIGNDVYVGAGTSEDDDVYHNDFFKFDGNSWSEITALKGEKRRKAMAVTLDGKAYVIGGFHNTALNDIWMYDPETNSWTDDDLAKLDDEDYGDNAIPRYNANAFVVGGKIYLVAGNQGNLINNTCWEWDPKYKEWIKKTSLTNSREGAGQFVLNDEAYIVGGRNGSSSFYDDLRKFYPDVEDDDNDDD